MPDLDEDLTFYQSIKLELESKNAGKWVLIYEKKVINFYEKFEDAANEAVSKFGSGPYLLRQIGAPSITLPASLAYMQHSHA